MTRELPNTENEHGHVAREIIFQPIDLRFVSQKGKREPCECPYNNNYSPLRFFRVQAQH